MGRTRFTSAEIAELRSLVREKQTADASRQKTLRARMRRIGFSISDFADRAARLPVFGQSARAPMVGRFRRPMVVVSRKETLAVVPAGTRPRRARQLLFWFVLAGVAVLVGAVVFVLARNDNGNPPVAQLKGSGVAATETRPLPRFEGIVVAVGANVVIRAAQKPAVVVRADDNLVHRITTRVRSGVLTVGSNGAGFTTKTPLTVMIGVPKVAALTVTHGGTVALRNVRGERLSVTLSGLGGSITASGAVGQLEATLRSFGSVQLRSVTARDVHAVLSGSGQIVVTATRKLDATLSGSGAIRYYGNPAQVRKTVVGDGSVSAR